MHINKKVAAAARRKIVRDMVISQTAESGLESLESRRMFSGTWSTITGAPGLIQMAMDLTDGTILAHGSTGNYSSSWYKLTPAANGSYTSGTWTTLTSSNVGRLYFASDVLQSGKVLTVGGEYASSGSFTRTGEIYDPAANTWTNTTNFPQGSFGDDPSVLLPNGQVLAGYISGPQTYIYDPVGNTWSATGTKLNNDQSDEESWVTLPNHNILSYSVFASINTGIPQAQVYNVATGTWSATGNLPAQLSAASVGYELGPGLLLPDGRVFYTGGTNATAYYNTSSNTWTAGPNMPNGYCMADAPGAVLPNGDVLLAMSPQGGIVGSNYNFPGPTHVYEFNPTTNIYTDVTPSVSGFSTGGNSFEYTFLVLPTGQVAMMGFNSVLAVYTESGSPLSAAVPVISGIAYSGPTGTYTLSGTNLNGINEGAAYGDDNQMASNYPLVRLIDAAGNTTYAKTTNWSLTGVMQGAETVTFTLPASLTNGAYLIQSVANGVPSATALAVLVNAHTTTNVTVKTDATPTSVDVFAGSSTIATFPDSSFTSIYIAGDPLGDTLTVNLNNSAGSITTYVQGGGGTDTINVNQTSSTGPVVINPSSGNDAVNVGTNGSGTAIAQFLASQLLGVVTIGNGGNASVGRAGSSKTLLQINNLVTSGTGVLDLGNNDMIVHIGSLAALIGQAFSGFNGGTWTGGGLISSAAGANTSHTTALGILLNNNSGGTLYGAGDPLGLFDGQNPSLSDVLVKYTYFGDANLSGHVDGSDYSNIDNGYLLHRTGWFNGDFNYDNTVDGSDYTLIDNAYNSQGSTIAAQIAKAQAVTASPAIALPAVDDQKHKKTLAKWFT